MTSWCLQITNIVFKGLCFSLAFYLIVLQLQNYFRNDDVSTIAFKQLNTNPEDHYPTFTFCLASSNNSNSKAVVGTQFVLSFVTKTITGKEVNEWERPDDKDKTKETDSDDDFPFYISYQDEAQTCFTRKEVYSNLKIHPEKVMRKFDKVVVDLKTLENNYETLSTLRVYLHNPGQFIRGIGKELVEGKISQISADNRNNFMHVTISQIGIYYHYLNVFTLCNK